MFVHDFDSGGLQIVVVAPLLNVLGIWQGRVAKQHGVPAVSYTHLIAALEKGIEGMENVDLFLATRDERLNEKAYIIPGLGDAGDRLYGLAE